MMNTERPNQSKYQVIRGCYTIQRAEAIHLAAQKFESPFIRLAREDEQYLTSGISKPDLNSNRAVRIPKTSVIVGKGEVYLHIEIRRGEGDAFWREVYSNLDPDSE